MKTLPGYTWVIILNILCLRVLTVDPSVVIADQSPVPVPAPIQELSLHSQWVSFAIRKEVWDFQRNASVLPDPKEGELLPARDTRYPEGLNCTLDKKFRVGIIGAGVSGLFTALTFDYLKQKYGLDVEYEILEANGEERLGGRLYTHYFKDKTDTEGKQMPKTFALFNELGMDFNDQDIEENREKNPPKPGQLVPYHLGGKNQPMLYNSVQVVRDGVREPTAEDFNITGLPIEIIKSNPAKLLGTQMEYYANVYKYAGPLSFWKTLMRTVDHYSVRQYLNQVASYDYNTIEFLETMDSGNRWYDQAFSETVLEALEFNATAKWWCVEEQKQAIGYNKRVIVMSYVDEGYEQIDVTVMGEVKPRRFDAVFNSATLGAMQKMGLEGLKLSWGTKQAIRSLGYGASCKIGVRFKSLWWIHKLGISDGGQARTDLPIRCCVYPSYNMHDPPDKPGVLLVSYTWSQEAERIGAMISRESPDNEIELIMVVLHDLARLHSSTEEEHEELKRIITEEYLDHYAYNCEAAHRAAQDYAAGKVPGPFGPVPPGVDDAAVPSPKGELARHLAMMEEIRLKQGGDLVDPSKVSEKDVAPILAVVSA
ncbi:hypothetical protein PG994_012015 [Apiospora phragmitis]|uniref:Amine oxidase domain-containing protein n=1 Tax=Apiospora phragmitis TaxID=2905665 RepID=A0ABR1TWP7_9PEZI